MLSYFDDYVVSITNLASAVVLPLRQVQVQRTLNGSSPLTLINPVNSDVAAGQAYTLELTVPVFVQHGRAVGSGAGGTTNGCPGQQCHLPADLCPAAVQSPGGMVDVSANQLPLAGGLTAFNVRVYNRGYAPMYFATTRGSRTQAGDLYISVLNPQGQEVSRTPFNGTPSGVIFYGDVGYVVVPPGGSTKLTVPDVLVPASLASNLVTFQAVVGTIYDRASPSGQQSSGPLVGSMQSSLSQTPYYATAQTDQQLYDNDQPIVITGQALDRITRQPVPNVPLKVGFATRGHYWYYNVTTDASGNYSYIYNVPPGLSGNLTLWAAHPDVYDHLDQAEVVIYRVYASPQAGDVRMSKNDTLQFNITLINPGNLPLTGFTTGFQANEMQGTNAVPTTKIQGTLTAPGFALAPGEQRSVTLQLATDADAPDNATGAFTLTSAEGASAKFSANIELLPAVPVVTVVQPDVGYVEVSVDRGALLSRQVTIKNSGLKDLKGVAILPPTNITWMVLNLPQAPDGTVPLPELPVGQSNIFTVVFTPPTNASLGSCQDKLTIKGTNTAGTFDVNLYALVTSANHGAVQFYVDDILGLDVPNATVRLRNTALGLELPAAETDINGLVTVTNLQEGEWSWQISAAGHSANVGVVTVVADQTVNVATRLSTSVVTVNFTVTPVPFTDKYDITIEQTFETHVPAPVLVLTPCFQNFNNVAPGFQATFIVTAKNEGLIQMTDVTLTGSQDGSATFAPLITYVPVLLPQQSVDIPFTFTYFGTNGPSRQGRAADVLTCYGIPNGEEIGEFIEGMNALAEAWAQCAKDEQTIAICAAVAVTAEIVQEAIEATSGIEAAVVEGASEETAMIFGCILSKLIGPIGYPPLGPLSAASATPTPQSVPAFEPIKAGCFAAETRVSFADGSHKTIDEVKPGDQVTSGPNRYDVAIVAAAYRRQANAWREIQYVLPGQTKLGVLRTTDEHLLWEDGRGWVAAARLEVGDWLLNEQGQAVRITANQRLPGSREAYTLKLRGDAAFYANGVLVHDVCGILPFPAPATMPTGHLELSK